MEIRWTNTDAGGERIVVIPGTPQPPEALQPLVDLLAANDAVVGLVVPAGYGGTDGTGVVDFERQAEVLASLIGTEPVSIVGVSAGAYRALQLVVAGVSVTRMVLVAPFTGPASEDERAAWRGLAALLRSDADVRPVALDRWFSEHERKAGNTRAVVDWLNATSRSHLADEVEALSALPDLVGSCGGVDVPTACMVGTEDVGFPVAGVQRLVDVLSRGRLEVVEHAGHALTTYHTARVVDTLRSLASR